MLGGITKYRYRTSIALCLLLLLTIVIHPDFDLPDAPMHAGHSTLHLVFLLTAVPVLPVIIAGIFHSDFHLIVHVTPPRLFLPLLC